MSKEELDDSERVFLESLEAGQVIKGTVSLVKDFGAFVDIGPVHGLINSVQLSWERIGHPSEAVRVGQEVTVTVLDVDLERARVALSLKSLQPKPFLDFARTQLDNIVHGYVTKLTPIGVFVRVHKGVEGLLPISEFARDGVGEPKQMPEVGEEVVVKIAAINLDKGRVLLQFPC